MYDRNRSRSHRSRIVSPTPPSPTARRCLSPVSAPIGRFRFSHRRGDGRSGQAHQALCRGTSLCAAATKTPWPMLVASRSATFRRRPLAKRLDKPFAAGSGRPPNRNDRCFRRSGQHSGSRSPQCAPIDMLGIPTRKQIHRLHTCLDFGTTSRTKDNAHSSDEQPWALLLTRSTSSRACLAQMQEEGFKPFGIDLTAP